MSDGSDDDSMGGMTFHDRLEFWGVEVAPGKRVDVAFDDGDEELVHITQARARTHTAAQLGARKALLAAARLARVVLCARWAAAAAAQRGWSV